MDPLNFQAGKTNPPSDQPEPVAPSPSDPVAPDLNPLAAEPADNSKPAPAPVQPIAPPTPSVVPTPHEPGKDPQAPVATTSVPDAVLPKENHTMMIVIVVAVALLLVGGLITVLA